jgi:hypothetical protein
MPRPSNEDRISEVVPPAPPGVRGGLGGVDQEGKQNIVVDYSFRSPIGSQDQRDLSRPQRQAEFLGRGPQRI